MNDSETADIVRRVVGTWPMSPKGPLWTEALGDLDYGHCLAAYTKLRDEHEEQRLSIARFLAVYRVIDRAGNTDRRHPSAGNLDEGPVMSLTEYIERHRWRAGTGDTTAQDDLAEWERAQQRGMRVGRTT